MRIFRNILMITLAASIALAFSTGANEKLDIKYASTKLHPFANLKQVTGKWLRVGQDKRYMVPTADPFVRIRPDGSVTVYGTGKRVLIFKSMDDFLRGGKYKVEELPFYYSDGKTALRGQEAIWDVNKYKFSFDEKTNFFKEFPKEESGIKEILRNGNEIDILLDDGTRIQSFLENGVLDVFYGGVINPTGGRKYARFPADNKARRSYAFVKSRDGKLVQLPKPLFGETTMSTENWQGHTYGRHVITDGRGNLILSKPGEFSTRGGRPVLCYEMISRLTGIGMPITEPFCREMVSPFKAADDASEVKMFHIDETKPFPSLVRTDGPTPAESSILMEGPRVTAFDNPVTGQRQYFMLVSGGDFSTDRYGIHVLISDTMKGPFKPLMKPGGRDLLDIGDEIRKTYRLSWGPARAHAFQDEQGRWKITFHATDKDILPGENYSTLDWDTLNKFNRNVYVADLDIGFDAHGNPGFQIQHRVPGSHLKVKAPRGTHCLARALQELF
ncbi:MAG TPA: hypothetical protein VJB59_09430 [Bdellovibrionota bacterium]|nr:hypothetical protein [Bdellovibrionota bacterium]